ncbi:hypothetical protein [Butyrivibrio sp. VCB2006]|uniref:hypothetical protein n=1 Tax=Butyrivibrio sp. VCB2006 TaxID=1280679 RepID=UPI0003FD8FD4|nr:hypothetical protein [Butyrivibrio sp. VCB2006]
MHKRIEILRILNNILIAVTVMIVALRIMNLSSPGAIVITCVSLSVFVLMSEAIQAFITNLIAFLGAHVAAIALCSYSTFNSNQKILGGVLFAGVSITSVIQAIHILFMIIITVIAIYARLDGVGRVYPTIYEGLLFVGLYFLCLITRQQATVPIVLLAEMVWGFMCIIFYNARQTIGALVTFKDRDYIPYESIKKTNGFMLRITLVIAFVFMIICGLIDYGKEVMTLLKTGLSAILRFIFSFFNFEAEEEIEAPPVTAGGGGSGMLLPEQQPDDSIWHTMWQILFWLVAIVVSIGVIIMIVMVAKEFYKLFNSSRKGIKDRLAGDKIEYLNPLSGSSGDFSSGKGSRMKLRERLSPAGRIRQLFFRYIDGSRSFCDISRADTPLEMESKVRYEKEASAYRLYEKARYSTKEITSEDVKKMKELCSNR